MCGFLFAHQQNGSESLLNVYHDAFSAMKHRGPDYTFYRTPKSSIFMGQHILSIVGSINEKHYEYKGLHLLYNGEIYNYDRSFDNDTEFLAHYLYENWDNIDFGQLDGMYAFVAYKDNQVVMGRDPFGQIPLYTFEDDQLLLASSEVHAIRDNRSLNLDYLKNLFFTRHSIDNRNSAYLNCQQLPPGYIRRYHSGVLVKEEVYGPKEFIEQRPRLLEEEYLEELDYLLDSNIRQMIPEPEFSAIISGGIDSSLVSWYISRQNGSSDSPTFVGLNNIGKDRVSCNVDKFEPYLNHRIKRVDVTREEWLEAFSWVVSGVIKDLPRSWSTISYYLVSKAVKPSKVLFTGEAADELFGGYADYLQPGTTKYSSYIRRNIFRSMPVEFQPEIELNPFLTDVINHVPVGCFAANTGAALNGIEARNPFLRWELARFALSLPSDYKVRNGQTKYLLRKLFERKFNKALIFEKQGFSAFPEDAYELPKQLDNFKKLVSLKVDAVGDDKWRIACGAMIYETL